MNDEAIDVLKINGECDFLASVKAKVQGAMARLKSESATKDESYTRILEEYCRLAMLPELLPDSSDEDVARLEEILALAEDDETLQFLIGEIDYLLSLQMEPLDEESVSMQQAWLSEHLTVNSTDTDFYRMLQLRLRKLGLYKGPIDGVLGQRSRKAVSKFQESHELQADGIPNPAVMSILLNKLGFPYD